MYSTLAWRHVAAALFRLSPSFSHVQLQTIPRPSLPLYYSRRLSASAGREGSREARQMAFLAGSGSIGRDLLGY
jgi:hypothetical protein